MIYSECSELSRNDNVRWKSPAVYNSVNMRTLPIKLAT